MAKSKFKASEEAYVASHLGITDRAARNLVEVSCERGILAKIGNAKREAWYFPSSPRAKTFLMSGLAIEPKFMLARHARM